jgi:hypothetical protein
MKVTRHFNVPEWTDFVRDLGEDAERTAMHQHLSTGCSRCHRIVGVLGRFAPIASLEATYEPAEQGVRCAEAIFQPQPHAAGARIRRESAASDTGQEFAGKTPARIGV